MQRERERESTSHAYAPKNLLHCSLSSWKSELQVRHRHREFSSYFEYLNRYAYSIHIIMYRISLKRVAYVLHTHMHTYEKRRREGRVIYGISKYSTINCTSADKCSCNIRYLKSLMFVGAL